MKMEAVEHKAAYPDLYLRNRNTLGFKIRTARGDVKKCILYYFSRDKTEQKKSAVMTKCCRDEFFDYFLTEVSFSQVARYQKYYFALFFGQEVRYLSAVGFSEMPPEDNYFEMVYANQQNVLNFPEWAKGAVYYQIFPERFYNGDRKNDRPETVDWGTAPSRENYMGGDLRGICEKLEYLRQLGVECLYLTPIFAADFNHKYATTDYFEIDPQFGDKDDLRELVQKAHDSNMKVILDGVFNHTGIHFFAFADILKNQQNSAYKDWYLLTQFPVTVSNACYECVGAYPYMPKLNTDSPAVREFLLKVMDYWIAEFGIDGWRLDVADEVEESVWSLARVRLKEKYPNILLLGETWGSGQRLLNGMQMDSIMNYTFRSAVCDFIAKGSISAAGFANRLGNMLAGYPPEISHIMFNLLDSHDTARFLFLCRGNKKKLILAVALQMLLPGAPSVYYGDEVGLTGDNDPDCRRCMPWDEAEQDVDIKAVYRRLISIRKENPCIRGGSLAVNVAAGQVFGFLRFDREAQEEIMTVVNVGETDAELLAPVLFAGKHSGIFNDNKEYEVIAGNKAEFENADMWDYQGVIPVKLKPMEAKILKGGSKK